MAMHLITRSSNLYFLYFLRTSNIIRMGAKGFAKLIYLVQTEVDYFFISFVVYC
jgi:hypothetical protein